MSSIRHRFRSHFATTASPRECKPFGFSIAKMTDKDLLRTIGNCVQFEKPYLLLMKNIRTGLYWISYWKLSWIPLICALTKPNTLDSQASKLQKNKNCKGIIVTVDKNGRFFI